MDLSHDQMIDQYKKMVTIRLFEEKVQDLYARGSVPGLIHLYIGEEAIAAGVCSHLRREDYITTTHRGHGHVIGKGAELKYILAEFMGRVDGYMSGKGGSMHISAGLDKGIFALDSVVGSRVGFGTGIALAFKLRKENKVVVAGYGDGGANQGVVQEAMNMAAIWKLPILFYCENNQYAATTSVKYSNLIKNLSERASAFGFSGETIDGMDVITVYNSANNAIEKIRSGSGPYLLECVSYRYRGHWSGEELQTYIKYRTDDEINYWKSKDPLKIFPNDLIEKYNCTEEELNKIDKEVEDIMEEAVEFARKSKFPEPENAIKDMYATAYEGIPHKGWID